MSLDAPEAVTCFWCLVQVVFAGSMGLPASPPDIYAPGLRRFYPSKAKPVEQHGWGAAFEEHRPGPWGALTTPDSPPRRTGHSSFWLMHSLMPCPGLESLPSALTTYAIFKVPPD